MNPHVITPFIPLTLRGMVKERALTLRENFVEKLNYYAG